MQVSEDGEITVWPFLFETLSTSPQNTYSVLRPKAMLDAIQSEVSPELAALFADLDALGADLSPTSIAGEDTAKAEGALSPVSRRALDDALAAWEDIPDTLR